MPRKKDVRKIVANTDEPRAGDFGFQFYDKSHPLNGDPETINRIRRGLRGLRGRPVIVTIRGARIDEDGTERKFSAKRSITLNRYTDLFGGGSVYSSAMHAIRERHSDEELVTYDITIEA